MRPRQTGASNYVPNLKQRRVGRAGEEEEEDIELLPSCLSIIVWENPAGQKRDNFANEGGAFRGCRLNNSGVQIVLENSQLHAAPPRSRANRLDLAPRSA